MSKGKIIIQINGKEITASSNINTIGDYFDIVVIDNERTAPMVELDNDIVNKTEYYVPIKVEKLIDGLSLEQFIKKE